MALTINLKWNKIIKWIILSKFIGKLKTTIIKQRCVLNRTTIFITILIFFRKRKKK